MLTFTLLLFPGCMDITGRGAAPLHKTIGAEAAVKPRVGHVYCMRGWLGIFSTGMDSLASEIDSDVGAPAVSVADEEWHRLKNWIVQHYKKGEINEPLVLLGHSWGADDVIRVAEYLQTQGINVDLLVLIDPVTPPAIPTNVKRAFCVYKSHPVTDTVPFWRGVSASVADPAATPLVNIDLRTTDVGFDTSAVDHINIEKSAGVHQMVMDEIKKTCPLRSEWVAQHPAASAISQARPAAFQAKTATP
jgi:pimeloyl-ACP methyl ester carboxylesterase